VLEGKIEFKDLMGSMLNIGSQHFGEEDLNEDDFN
jgi:magnesium chelatase subunit I